MSIAIVGAGAIGGQLGIKLAHAGEDVTFDAPMPYRGGTTRQSEIRYVPRRAEGGAIDGFFVMVTDISERQAVQADLQEAEGRLRLALEGAGTGIYDYDLVTGALTWDAAAQKLAKGQCAFASMNDSFDGELLAAAHAARDAAVGVVPGRGHDRSVRVPRGARSAGVTARRDASPC